MTWWPNKKSKYHAKKTELDGIVFDSKKEANYYATLLLLQKSGEVVSFERQVQFELQPHFRYNGKMERAITYVADFVVTYKDGHTEVIDVKGMRTREYNLKRKLLLFRHPDMIFREV